MAIDILLEENRQNHYEWKTEQAPLQERYKVATPSQIKEARWRQRDEN